MTYSLRLNARFNRTRLIHGLCLMAAGLINAVLFLTLVRALRPGSTAIPTNEVVQVVILSAAREETASRIPEPTLEDPHLPSRELGEAFEPEPEGPPTETPESVQRRREEAQQRQRGERAAAFQCRAIGTSETAPRVATLTLHVGVDGQVLEAAVDRSSGVSRIDQALMRCARSWGPFPVAIIDGRLLESWQSIDWPPASAPERAGTPAPTP